MKNNNIMIHIANRKMQTPQAKKMGLISAPKRTYNNATFYIRGCVQQVSMKRGGKYVCCNR